jgi:hypothetical protein
MQASTSSADTSTQLLFYHMTHITLCSDHFMWQQAVQTEDIPICHQSVPHLSVHCTAVNITILLTALLQLLEMVGISSQAHCHI